MIIKNKEDLSGSELRKEAVDILEAGIEGVSPEKLLSSLKYDYSKKILKIKGRTFKIRGRIFVVGVGKASGKLAEKLEEIIPDIEAGVISCKENYKLKRIMVVKACHPIPCRKSIKSAKLTLSLKSKYNINKNDIILCLISGGISSLLVYPAKGISLRNKKKIDKLLIDSGANISEINIVRKHISKIKGGNLAKFFYPARVISLILSDVVGDDLSSIGSGPTIEDHSTYEDAYEILKRYNLIRKTPKRILKRIKKGIGEEIEETPKRIYNSYNFLVGNNNLALKSMKDKAKSLGFKPYIIKGQKGNCQKTAVLKFKDVVNGKYKKKNAIIIGGEIILKVPKKHGKGGRNQHYVLVSLNEIIKSKTKREIVITSIGTDGSDYINGIAGAIVDNDSAKKTEERIIKIEKYINNYDSYNFFRKIGGSIIKTGSTGTNVSDIMLYLIR